MRTMEDKMCKTKREQIRRTCGEISRKSSFLYAFPEELTYEDLQMLKNINHKINVVHMAVFRRMHSGSEKE